MNNNQKTEENARALLAGVVLPDGRTALQWAQAEGVKPLQIATEVGWQASVVPGAVSIYTMAFPLLRGEVSWPEVEVTPTLPKPGDS